MSAEPGAQRRKQLVTKSVLNARAEAGKQRGGEHLRRHRFFDRCVDCPPALAGIVDEPAELGELRAFGERHRRQIEQPGGDDAAAPPYFGYVSEIQLVTVRFGKEFTSLAAQDR